ncbi:MAG: hypothetical protein HY305_03450 [Sphingobacteriales bacterium]|nr:hypothetical protein [Sphingobacteriales bacterium]
MANTISNGENIKALIVVHRALLLCQLLFAAAAFYFVYANKFEPILQQQDKVFQVIAIIFSTGGFLLGSSIFKKRIKKIKQINKKDIASKIAEYRSASIIQWALIEGPCLFSVMCFMLIGNYSFLALATVLIITFGILAPSKIKIAFYIQVSEKEMME